MVKKKDAQKKAEENHESEDTGMDLVDEEWLRAEEASNSESHSGEEVPLAAGETEMMSQEPAGRKLEEAGEPDAGDKVVPLAALHEERQKRQERDKKIETLETSLGLQRLLTEQLAGIETDSERYNDEDPITHAQAREVYTDKDTLVQMFGQMIGVCAELERLKHGDYDEVMKVFEPYLNENAGFQQMVFSASNPAAEAYRLAKQLLPATPETGSEQEGSETWPGTGEKSFPMSKNEILKEKMNNQEKAPKISVISGEGDDLPNLTIEKLLEMPRDEFGKVWDNLTSAQKRKFSGG